MAYTFNFLGHSFAFTLVIELFKIEIKKTFGMTLEAHRETSREWVSIFEPQQMMS